VLARKTAFALTGALLMSAPLAIGRSGRDTSQQAPTLTVYKSPACGCCTKWVEHLRAAGYTVVARNVENLDPVKLRYGVPNGLESCHTAVAAGYVFEGHIPAEVIRKFLAERPAVAGLAVPGMPAGSPGMEGPRAEPYDVLAFDKDGTTSVYAKR
jgi:hypothetical protein